MIIDDDKKKLFKMVRTKLGAPVRSVELTDEMLCDLLSLAIADYAEKAQNFVIENNWFQIYGKQYANVSNIDMAYAMSVRTLDLAKDYSYFFSKEVGLQQRGNFELKKDFFNIECGRQVYEVPAGREICKVMWVTPPTTDAAMWANYGGLAANFGGGVMGQMGMGAATVFGGMGGSYGMGVGLWALPAADVWYMAADMKQKNQLFRGDLVYKVTAGPNGTHLIHLESTPGSKLTFGLSGMAGTFSLAGCTCWYTYYDTTNGDADECRRENANDIILSPDQVPFDELDWSQLNSPTQALVRQLLIAEAAETLGFIRGKFSGNINMVSSSLTLDYSMFISMGQREKDNAMNTLKERFERMSPWYQMEKQASLVENMNKILKQTPLGIYVI